MISTPNISQHSPSLDRRDRRSDGDNSLGISLIDSDRCGWALLPEQPLGWAAFLRKIEAGPAPIPADQLDKVVQHGVSYAALLKAATRNDPLRAAALEFLNPWLKRFLCLPSYSLFDQVACLTLLDRVSNPPGSLETADLISKLIGANELLTSGCRAFSSGSAGEKELSDQFRLLRVGKSRPATILALSEKRLERIDTWVRNWSRSAGLNSIVGDLRHALPAIIRENGLEAVFVSPELPSLSLVGQRFAGAQLYFASCLEEEDFEASCQRLRQRCLLHDADMSLALFAGWNSLALLTALSEQSLEFRT